ncbi:MAG TPA: alkaline phosphatase family protein [Stellaceae bacterium]|nr:alkaline phosphatase family protein [Stellaceae bacterium]
MSALTVSTIASTSFAGSSLARDSDALTTKPIKHLVVIFQENISFDHYFATYPNALNLNGEPKFVARDDTPGVNGLTGGLLDHNPNSKQPNRLSPAQAVTCDEDHNYSDEQKAVDGGLLDKFVEATGRTGVGCKPDDSTVMGYFDGNTVTALWNYAQRFSLSDNSFDTNFGPSTVGALNLISGQTHGVIKATIGVNGIPTPTTTTIAGTVFFPPGGNIGTVIGDPQPLLDDCSDPAHRPQVQLSGRNVGDLLNEKGLTWGWFNGGFAPTVPFDPAKKTPAVCGSSHIGHPGVANPTDGNSANVDVHVPIVDYVPHHSPFQYYAQTSNPHHLRPSSVAMIGKTDQANHIYDLTDFFSALDASRMPAVSFLKAAAFQDGHPGNSDPISEQTFLVQTLNKLQQSPEWPETAVIILYDDSDGWYDHVTGAIVSPSATPADFLAGAGNCGAPVATAFPARCGYGPRQPFLVISPWAKENFVDHTTTDLSSVLRFIEDNWGLGFIDGPTEPPAGQASFDRIAGTLLNMFDFDDQPNPRPLILNPSNGQKIGGDDRADARSRP